ncbi:terminus macrodomain insulation protein YfbV [Orbus sturtevantii]|uniref:terminus macrodomain insulation protein YfbV n=1 Tax=Orbus sturtevantii TaxID=3074109 RepID=UPI00370D772E
MNVIKLFKTGHKYMTVCSTDKSLASSFPEIKIIFYIKMANRYLPPLIIALFIWQFYMHANIITTVITAIFAFSLPVQGILWLGKRASLPLPLNLLPWYIETQQKLVQLGVLAKKSVEKETIDLMHFMQLYQISAHHLDDEYPTRHDS